MDARTVLAARNGLTIFQQGRAVASLVHELREQIYFRKFFLCEREPAFEFSIQFCFVLQTNRRMKQRTRRRNDEPFVADGFRCLSQQLQRTLKIVPPDVATIHDTERKLHCRRQLGEQAIQFVRRTHSVEVERVHRQLAAVVRLSCSSPR